jgi:hypothetical protein
LTKVYPQTANSSLNTRTHTIALRHSNKPCGFILAFTDRGRCLPLSQADQVTDDHGSRGPAVASSLGMGWIILNRLYSNLILMSFPSSLFPAERQRNLMVLVDPTNGGSCKNSIYSSGGRSMLSSRDPERTCVSALHDFFSAPILSSIACILFKVGANKKPCC